MKLEPNTNGTKNVKSQINFFLISKKKRFVKALETKLEVNGKEICDQAKITDKIKIFFAAAFKCHKGKSLTNLFNILNSIDLPCLTNKQKDFCEIELGLKQLFNVFKFMPNNKILENDRLSKEFYKVFWNELKNPLLKIYEIRDTRSSYETELRKMKSHFELLTRKVL